MNPFRGGSRFWPQDHCMRRLSFVAVALSLSCWAVEAATITNEDDERRSITVAEGHRRIELVIPAGVTDSFCLLGCFISWGDGERAALMGDENLVIRNGKIKIFGEE